MRPVAHGATRLATDDCLPLCDFPGETSCRHCFNLVTFRPTGGKRVPVRTLGGGPGTRWVGAGEAFGQDPLPATLVVLHAPQQQDPWVLLTDTPPAETDADLYACRHWIEQGFRGPGGAAGPPPPLGPGLADPAAGARPGRWPALPPAA
jgi:hypothetical protein